MVLGENIDAAQPPVAVCVEQPGERRSVPVFAFILTQKYVFRLYHPNRADPPDRDRAMGRNCPLTGGTRAPRYLPDSVCLHI
jgi:hypothetical protein